MKAKHSCSSQPFLHCNTSQKGLGLFIKCLANKGPVNWQAIAFTASYHNLWESFRPKLILHTSIPMRCHTHSYLKPPTRSATAISHKTFVFTRHFWNHVQPFHPLLASRFFVCLFAYFNQVLCFLQSYCSVFPPRSFFAFAWSGLQQRCLQASLQPNANKKSPLIRDCLLTSLLYC